MKILVVDVGGNKLKILVSGQKEAHKVPSGPHLSAAQMVAAVRRAVAGERYDRVSVGYPGPVRDNRPAEEPFNLGRGWVRFDYERGFGKPVRFINDAAMQALGSYDGGRMLFLGLGTGLGSALVLDGLVQPLEMAHLLYRNGKTYEDFLGKHGLDRAGKKRWRRLVFEIVPRLRHAFQVDEVVIGGGNSKQLKELPPATRLGDNANAFLGGARLWQGPPRRKPAARR